MLDSTGPRGLLQGSSGVHPRKAVSVCLGCEIEKARVDSRAGWIPKKTRLSLANLRAERSRIHSAPERNRTINGLTVTAVRGDRASGKRDLRKAKRPVSLPAAGRNTSQGYLSTMARKKSTHFLALVVESLRSSLAYRVSPVRLFSCIVLPCRNPEGAMSHADWMISGPQISTCNCDWGCPCVNGGAIPGHWGGVISGHGGGLERHRRGPIGPSSVSRRCFGNQGAVISPVSGFTASVVAWFCSAPSMAPSRRRPADCFNR